MADRAYLELLSSADVLLENANSPDASDSR